MNYNYSLRHWDLVQLQGFRCFNPFDSRTLSEDLDWDPPGVAADDVAGDADSGDGTGAGRGCRDEEDEADAATGVLTGVGVVSVTDMVVTDDDPAPEQELFGKVVEDEFKVGVELCFDLSKKIN